MTRYDSIGRVLCDGCGSLATNRVKGYYDGDYFMSPQYLCKECCSKFMESYLKSK